MLRLVEHYTSIQGEGHNTSTLTQFVRFAGCNMRCPGWPCDTQHAIDPAIFRHNSYTLAAADLSMAIMDEYAKTGAANVCFTGGEPFLQNNEELRDVCKYVRNEGMNLEVFTNGSFIFPAWTREVGMEFMMDWKLAGSGEQDTKVENRLQNAKYLNAWDGIKFVVKDESDLDEAYKTMMWLTTEGVVATYWIGRVWDAEVTDEELVDFIKFHKMTRVKLNVQIHKYIYDPEEQGV